MKYKISAAVEQPIEDTRPEAGEIGVCSHCGNPIAAWMTWYDIGGETVHDDCMLDYVFANCRRAGNE